MVGTDCSLGCSKRLDGGQESRLAKPRDQEELGCSWFQDQARGQDAAFPCCMKGGPQAARAESGTPARGWFLWNKPHWGNPRVGPRQGQEPPRLTSLLCFHLGRTKEPPHPLQEPLKLIGHTNREQRVQSRLPPALSMSALWRR